MRFTWSALAIVMVCGTHAFGQPAPTGSQGTTSPAPTTESEAASAWSFSATVFTYVVPDEGNYGLPIVAAEHDRLRFEARYNYEDRDTASLWVGYKFAGGDPLEWEVSPMFGAVFGQTTGVAPGYQASVSWSKLDFYSEGEYVFDTGDSSDSFFYNWSEFAVVPVDWFRVGLVTQRTRVYKTDRDVQRGLLVGFSYKDLEATTYVFNPDDSKPVVVISVGVSF
jgi:hypothetical protein